MFIKQWCVAYKNGSEFGKMSIQRKNLICSVDLKYVRRKLKDFGRSLIYWRFYIDFINSLRKCKYTYQVNRWLIIWCFKIAPWIIWISELIFHFKLCFNCHPYIEIIIDVFCLDLAPKFDVILLLHSLHLIKYKCCIVIKELVNVIKYIIFPP
jgi:hypothetical protein